MRAGGQRPVLIRGKRRVNHCSSQRACGRGERHVGADTGGLFVQRTEISIIGHSMRAGDDFRAEFAS